jgi:hypothetical protein
LVREYRDFQRVSHTPKEQYYLDIIEVQYNNYSEATLWCYFSYDYKELYHIYIKEPLLQMINWAQLIAEKKVELEPQLRREFVEQEAKATKCKTSCLIALG